MSERFVVVTGASSGIGAAVAEAFARAGDRVALLARRTERLEQVVRTLPRPAEHLVVTCDLRREADIVAAFKSIGASWPRIDVLVNNAGIGYRARVEEIRLEPLQALFETNVIAVLLACRNALPLLRPSPNAHVINISSVVGRRGIPGQSAYAASKAAVCSIGEALRIEWEQERVRVSTLSPALTATGFFEAQENPSALEQPDLADAQTSQDVAREVIRLTVKPQAERSLRWKWKALAFLSLLMPERADRILARRLGEEWHSRRRTH